MKSRKIRRIWRKIILSLRASTSERGNPQGFARVVARSNHPPIKKYKVDSMRDKSCS